MRLFREKHITVSYHSVEFDGHRLSGSEDMFLGCYVISQDQAIKRSCKFVGGDPHFESSPWHVCWPMAFGNRGRSLYLYVQYP